jgi:hypothetical protein
MNDRTMTIIKRLLGALGTAALIGGGAAMAAPAANADPYGSCGYGSPSISSPWGGFCRQLVELGKIELPEEVFTEPRAPAPVLQQFHCAADPIANQLRMSGHGWHRFLDRLVSTIRWPAPATWRQKL